jgi:hypothetical protein
MMAPCWSVVRASASARLSCRSAGGDVAQCRADQMVRWPQAREPRRKADV